jgi:diguanylate cyclase (GGDEF)-like protein
VFTRQERLWQESKHEAVQALAAGFARKMSQVKDELTARDATVSSISRYFEQLVADLTDKAHRDPKTKLINFAHFTDQVESFLALDQRGRWCALGLVDIAGFKRYNDTLGHGVGDRIIERVARLLREQVRCDDLLAQDRGGASRPGELHARFGGDEFCFFVHDLDDYHLAYAVGERFRESVARFDWTVEDARLGHQPVRVDVGVVCLWLGTMAERRAIARKITDAMVHRADMLMYEAKGQRAEHVHLVRARIVGGEVVEMAADEAAIDPGVSRSRGRVLDF